ncbi:Fic family protein [Halobacteriovorax sp. JY17]|uniref:Fic family protein n=1 Tax=Halobacteriovorax sp. JY17 TaxID=2014617 RepID=UPI000C3F21CC|nr:Fic family protein [Halobacteriovorax sp. JY17]PIK14728.1 MAG: cell filamentation protein Fic [Halobacteriovorax sp. JY17]
MSIFVLEDFYFGSSTLRRKLSSEGKIRKIYTGLYTSVMNDQLLKEKMRYSWPIIVSNCFKSSVVSYRTAIEFKPSPEGYIFLVSKNTKLIEIGGIKFKHIRGVVESSGNRNSLMGANIACKERAFLELLITSRSMPEDDRYLDQKNIEEKLEELLKQTGENGLNEFRDKAKEISVELNLSQSFKKLDKIIGSLLGSNTTDLKSPKAISRAKGLPIDTDRIALFMNLASHMETLTYPKISHQFTSIEHIENKSFFESYFSNYIEGTEFLIEEAEEIIFDKKEIENRVQDSHDILGTFEVCSDMNFMKSSPDNSSDFINDLQTVNRRILSTRDDKSPGDFKVKPNKAGNTYFVAPDYVEGTLRRAFEIYQTILEPISRAVFLSFIVSEIHPFNDGNGRTSRIILNRELLSNNYPSLIIPTVYREDYIGALRTLSRKGRTSPICNMFLRALHFSNLDFSNYQEIKKELQNKNWFIEPQEGKIIT